MPTRKKQVNTFVQVIRCVKRDLIAMTSTPCLKKDKRKRNNAERTYLFHSRVNILHSEGTIYMGRSLAKPLSPTRISLTGTQSPRVNFPLKFKAQTGESWHKKGGDWSNPLHVGWH